MAERGKWLADARWVGIGVIIAVVLAAIGWMVSIAVANGQSQASPVDGGPPTTTPGPDSESTSRTTVGPTATPTESAPSQAPELTTLYLKDLDDDSIVQDPHWVWDSSGPATIAGVTYPNSLAYEFQNCSSCTESLEFIVPSGFTRLTGTFGLSDSSRHDDVIDGVVYLAVYDAAGNQILSPQRIEYPQSVPVDLSIEGQPRIRIEMSEGTNNEQFVLGDAALVQ